MSQRQLGEHGHPVRRVAPATDFGIRTRSTLFGISPDEARFARRGFADTEPEARERLEAIGVAFIDGYNAWLADELDATLAVIPHELQGFVVEGAAMASALVDHLTPWRRDRWAGLLQARPDHVYMIHVGAGWATARLGLSLGRAIGRRDPLLGWLVADGWGFHQTYFHPARWASGRARVSARSGYLARAVDQGVGRALWFVAGADPARVAAAIARFAADRHADLWGGVGLAATYAGGCEPDVLAALTGLAGAFEPELAQGAAFAATARGVAGNTTAHTELASRAITGRSAAELHRLAIEHQPAPPHAARGACYEAWRDGLARALARGVP